MRCALPPHQSSDVGRVTVQSKLWRGSQWSRAVVRSSDGRLGTKARPTQALQLHPALGRPRPGRSATPRRNRRSSRKKWVQRNARLPSKHTLGVCQPLCGPAYAILRTMLMPMHTDTCTRSKCGANSRDNAGLALPAAELSQRAEHLVVHAQRVAQLLAGDGASTQKIVRMAGHALRLQPDPGRQQKYVPACMRLDSGSPVRFAKSLGV